jgi:hypothetical protein
MKSVVAAIGVVVAMRTGKPAKALCNYCTTDSAGTVHWFPLTFGVYRACDRFDGGCHSGNAAGTCSTHQSCEVEDNEFTTLAAAVNDSELAAVRRLVALDGTRIGFDARSSAFRLYDCTGRVVGYVPADGPIAAAMGSEFAISPMLFAAAKALGE